VDASDGIWGLLLGGERVRKENRRAENMNFQTKTPGGRILSALGLSAAVALASIPLAPPAFADGPFGVLVGDWSGSGTIKTKTGTKERIRCKVGYDVGSEGSKVEQVMRCASDSYKFDVKANYAYSDGAISGAWVATSYNLTGSVSGSANAQKISAKIRGDGLSINVAITTSGANQSVSLVSEGTEISEITIKLKKGSI
jgi:hypothetical protein